MTEPVVLSLLGVTLTATAALGAYTVHLTRRLNTVTCDLADAQETVRDLAALTSQQSDFLAFLENERRLEVERVDSLDALLGEFGDNYLTLWAEQAPVAGD